MEYKPLLLQLTQSQIGKEDCYDFEFPISSSAVPNDIVFTRKGVTNYKKLKHDSLSNEENQWRRIIERESSLSLRRKHCNGLFGIVKFPLQMELSDMKMRQERRMTLIVAAGDGGVCGSVGSGKSCWEIVRPLVRRIRLLKALAKARFGG